MKRFQIIPILAALGLVAASCSVKEKRNLCLAPVTVRINDLEVSQENFPGTKAVQDVSDYSGIKAITLAFYGVDGYEQYKATQLREDTSTYTTFGEFTCSIPIGSYTMVAVGYGSTSEINLSSATSASYSDQIRDTFTAVQEVSVSSTAPLDLTETLGRITSKLAIRSTDGRSSGITRIRASFSAGGQGFNPSTGLATSNSGFSNIMTPSSAVGAPIDIGSFLFLSADEQEIDVTIEALDEDDNVLFTKSVSNVPFKRNRITLLSGPVFSAAASSAGFRVEKDWIPYITVDL
ncbi:MAG: hypothetical protein J5748_04640 [Bacteroidales bacterium]|nr:hypothetical protein [Bacteroidales bacterium]